MSALNKRTVAGLDVLEVPGDPGGPVVLLFHGYGSDAGDLVPLQEVFQGPPKPTWLFPNGPLEVPLGMGYVGRGWFPLDIDKLTQALHTGTLDRVTQAFPPEFSEAKKRGEQLIAELHIPPASLFIGGFSQGAVLATDLALAAEENVAGLLVLSGTLVEEKKWNDLATHHSGLPFFLSHGTGDPVLPFERAQALEKLFLRHHLRGRLTSFAGGHEIPQTILKELHRFFTKNA